MHYFLWFNGVGVRFGIMHAARGRVFRVFSLARDGIYAEQSVT